MKRFFVLLACLSLGFAINSAHADQQIDPHEFGYIELPPFGYTDDNGEIAGYLADLSRVIFERLERPVHYRELPASRLYHQIRAGDTAMTMGPKGLDQLSDAAHESSEPAVELTLSLYRRSDTPSLTSLEQLRGKRVVLMQGYSYGKLVRFFEEEAEDMQLIEARTHTQALEMLRRERADYLLSYQTPVDTVKARNGVSGLSSDVVGRVPIHLFVSHQVPDGQQIVQEWDRELADLRQTSQLPPMDFYLASE